MISLLREKFTKTVMSDCLLKLLMYQQN